MRRALFAAALLLAACRSGTLTEIVAVSDSDLRGADAIDSVRFEVRRPGGGLQTSIAPFGGGSPAFVGIVHEGGPLGPIEVRAVGLRGADEVLDRRARVSFLEGRTVVLRLDLFARCLTESCGEQETCGQSGCRSIEVTPGELTDWTGSPGTLDGGASDLDAGGDAAVDAGARDAGRDAGSDAGCVATGAELCNGIDDDCDGALDEGFMLDSDAANCGECGNGCGAACDARVCEGDFVAIAVGGSHACAVDALGRARCWGENADGQLGDGSSDASATPVAVSGGLVAEELAAGLAHTCARDSSGSVRCWGAGGRGQLGDGGGGSATPVLVPGVTGAVSICAGDDHTCAVDGAGRVHCFGANDEGQAGGTGGSITAPFMLALTGVREVACGARHTCAIVGSGRELHCWGDNAFSQLGRTGTGGATPMAVTAVTGVVHAAAGDEHTCFLLATGGARCFGRNTDGQLGDGTVMNNANPRDVVDLTDAIALAAGGHHTCAVRRNGLAVCWGRESSGALGNGETSTIPERRPAAVRGLADAARVFAGPDATCARRAGARLSCWGTMPGGLGDGSGTASPTPVEVTLP